MHVRICLDSVPIEFIPPVLWIKPAVGKQFAAGIGRSSWFYRILAATAAETVSFWQNNAAAEGKDGKRMLMTADWRESGTGIVGTPQRHKCAIRTASK